MSIENKTIERIRKLLAIANDARGNVNECASAAAMAAKLMAKFNIEMADVIVEELNKDGSIVDEFIAESNYDKKVPAWYNILVTCIGQTLDCVCRMKSTINLKGQYKIGLQVLGYKQDVEVAKWLFAYINSQFDKLTNEKWAGQVVLIKNSKGRDPNPAERKKYKDTYRYGLALGVCSKIRDNYAYDVMMSRGVRYPWDKFNTKIKIDNTEPDKTLIEISKLIGHPVFVILDDSYHGLKISRKCPHLAKLGLAEVYPDTKIYQDLSYFMGNLLHLSPDMMPEPKPPMTNEEKIVSHGFDSKKSFRHRKVEQQ